MTRFLGLTLASTLAFPSIAAAAEPVPAPAAAVETQPAAPSTAEAPASAVEPLNTAMPEPVETPPDPFAAESDPEASTGEPPAPVLTTATTSSIAPPPVVRPTPKLPKSGEAMLITGASMFGTMYLATSFAGAVAIDDAREVANADWLDDDDKRGAADDLNRGRALTIPLAGPFIAMRFTDSAKRRYGLAVNGSVQVVGLALAVVGAMRHKRYRAAKRRWHMSASADATSAQLGMQMRF